MDEMKGSLMNLGLSLLLLAGMAASEGSQQKQFDNYGDAYRAAQQTGRPLLVILNPGADSVSEVLPIAMEAVQKSKKRRELLNNYVVAVVDTGTEKGKATHQLFKSPELPRVVVIDKQQKKQLFQSSEELYGQLWTTILETYRKGERPAGTPIVPDGSKSSKSRPAYRLLQSKAVCHT
ncbi:MAG: hypothetical protein HOL01_07945 [Planctomycetaceae bacterium]|jgi:hypothetical protein|nr:hypothetical protein [Planctomycetaceae bacterium]